MDQMNSDNNLQQWAALIEDAVSSGLTREAWCEKHGISKWQYYYWNRKLKKIRESGSDFELEEFGGGRNSCSMKPETAPVFYELPIAVTDPCAGTLRGDNGSTEGTSMILEFGVYRLTIPRDVDANALQTVIRAASHA